MTRRVVAAVLVALGCGGSERAPEPASFHAWFQDLRARSDRGDESWEAVEAGALQALPIVRIEMERVQIGYVFSSLELVFEPERAFRRGGSEEWPSDSDEVTTAEVPFHEYARLCWLIESLELPRTSIEWSVPVSHQEQLDITWTTRDGRTVELSDYGSAGPPAVAALAAALQGTARGLTWTPAGNGEDEDTHGDR